MQVVPVQPLQNQTLQAQLGGQACTINLHQFMYGMFCDVLVAGEPIRSGIVCQNLNRVVRSAYLGFAGDLIFVDTQGTSDPVYTGLGSRWQLVYLEASDVAGR